MFFPCLCVSSKSEGKDAHSLHVLACFLVSSVFRNMSPPQSVAPLTPTKGLSDSREQGTLLVPTNFPLSGINMYGRTRSIWSWKMQSRPAPGTSVGRAQRPLLLQNTCARVCHHPAAYRTPHSDAESRQTPSAHQKYYLSACSTY